MPDDLIKVKYVKGSIIYVVGKFQYLERPTKASGSKMMYSPSQNITYIFMKKNSMKIEIACILIMLASLIFLNVYEVPFTKFYYSENIIFYEDTLYLNIHNGKDSEFEIKCDLYLDSKFVESRYLKQGDIWSTYETDECPSDCFIEVKYIYPLFEEKDIYKISILDRSDK